MRIGFNMFDQALVYARISYLTDHPELKSKDSFRPKEFQLMVSKPVSLVNSVQGSAMFQWR